MKRSLIFLFSIIFIGGLFAADIPSEFVLTKNISQLEQSLQTVTGSIGESGTAKVWVFFTDKGFSALSDYYTYLETAKSSLTQKSLMRRAKARGQGNEVGFTDIDVNQAYIDQVLATGASLRREIKWFNAVTIEATAEQLAVISQLPFVHRFKKVSTATYPLDYVKESSEMPDAPVTNTTNNYGYSLTQLNQINAVAAHELGFSGQDVLVQMHDTGFKQSHTAFQNIINEERLIAQYDFINDDDDTDYDPNQDAENQPRHGTLTWSTLGGESEGNLYGPAYNASFTLAKTEDITSEHHIEEDNWAAAAIWGDSIGIDVISASLGYRYDFDAPDESYTYEDMNGDSTIVTQAADLAVYNGIAVATSQGNDGNYGAGSLIAPADGDSVMAIGAVMETDENASFTGLGPTFDGRTKPEICALGVSTACADPNDMNGFTWASGTSLSCPLAGGVTAMLLSAHPHWTPMMVREALMMTATQAENPDNLFGWGIIDVAKALYYHPENDVVINHHPLVFFPAGLDNNVITATITGPIYPGEVYLCWRTDEAAEFIEELMYTENNVGFEGIVPGLDDGYFQYYIKVGNGSGFDAVLPYGAPEHFFTVSIGETYFEDTFENGLHYWNTPGTSNTWALTAEQPNNGNLSITDSPYRYYNNDVESIIESNFMIPLYMADSAVVQFSARYMLESGADYVYFEGSGDGGQTWMQIGAAITGINMNYTQFTYPIGDLLGAGVKFRFRIVTNSNTTRQGIHIDDFNIVWYSQTGVEDGSVMVPVKFKLDQNYPNPFNATTRIAFTISSPSDVKLEIFDILGKAVKKIIDDNLEAGSHEVIWQGKDESGSEVASGVYFYKVTADDKTAIRRMVLLK